MNVRRYQVGGSTLEPQGGRNVVYVDRQSWRSECHDDQRWVTYRVSLWIGCRMFCAQEVYESQAKAEEVARKLHDAAQLLGQTPPVQTRRFEALLRDPF